ncbi:MAG: hypothetical protein Q4D38_09450 [Planctomycetia bacterium]|nr:hypothetical protein [Planctomycetia bacterium]
MNRLDLLTRRSLIFASVVIFAILATLAVTYFSFDTTTPPLDATAIDQFAPQPPPETKAPDPNLPSAKVPTQVREELREMVPEASEESLFDAIAEAEAKEILTQSAASAIEREAEAFAQKSNEEQMQRLGTFGSALRRTSSSESLEEISEIVVESQGLAPRALEPAFLPPEGEFDYNSAQVHDCTREKREDGTYQYTAVLFDKAGRSMTLEMTPEEGEPLYRTMRMIKVNPLMEQVYRTMVIPLLDKKLGEAKKVLE